jgi:carboxylesterase type B
MAPPVATVRAGQLRGSFENGIYVFKGIPYGAPTGTENILAVAQVAAKWLSRFV